jgi:hypothetical protein
MVECPSMMNSASEVRSKVRLLAPIKTFCCSRTWQTRVSTDSGAHRQNVERRKGARG